VGDFFEDASLKGILGRSYSCTDTYRDGPVPLVAS